MKRFSFNTVLLGTLLMWLGADALARLVVDQPERIIQADFFQDQVEVVFKVSNQGDRVVNILDVDSSCDCTVPELHDKQLSPQESVDVKLSFKFGDRIGKQIKTVTLSTDSKEFPRVVLTLNVVIPQAISFKPAVMIWRPEEQRDPKETLVTVSQDPRVKLVGVGKLVDGLVAELHPVAKRPELKRLRILPAGYLRSGVHQVPVRIKINKKEMVILLRLRFLGPPTQKPPSEDSSSNTPSSFSNPLPTKPEADE